jgi:RelE toxin of RelEB toxin-antitoxin system
MPSGSIGSDAARLDVTPDQRTAARTDFTPPRAGAAGRRAAGAAWRSFRPNEGKSGGFRSIVLFRSGEKAFFVYGFAKNAQDNIGPKELKAFKLLADEMFSYGDAALLKAIEHGALTEVEDDAQESK